MTKLFKHLTETLPYKIDDKVQEGSGVKEMSEIKEFLSVVVQSAVSTIPEKYGFRFLGIKRSTPLEEFYQNLKTTKNKIDVSKSSLMKLTLVFEHQHGVIERLLYLPYVDRGGIITLSDTEYIITNVLSDYPISRDNGEVFIRVMRDKLNVKLLEYIIKINGVINKQHVIHAKTYKLLRDKTNPRVPLALYGFLKYGFNNIFKMLGNTHCIILGENETPPEGYTVFATSGKKPRGATHYKQYDISFAVPSKDVNEGIILYLTGLIFSLDNNVAMAYDIKKAIVKTHRDPNKTVNINNMNEEQLFFVRLLGAVIFRNGFTVMKIISETLEHVEMYNDYLDIITKDKLKHINIEFGDMYDLLHYAMVNFNNIINTENMPKYLNVLYYVMYDIVIGINKAFLEIKRAYIKKNTNVSSKDIVKSFNRYLTPRKIFGLISGFGGLNICISPIDTCSDNLYYGITSTLELQSRANGVKKDSKNSLPKDTRNINGDLIQMGSLLHLLKKAPTPLLKMNPYVRIDPVTNRFILKDMKELDYKLKEV